MRVLTHPVLRSLVIVAGFYWILHDWYRPTNLDDPWFGSFIWNSFKHGIEDRDILVGAPAGSGMVGVNHFGKLWSLVYGMALEMFGWSRGVLHAVSATLTLIALSLWGKAAHQVGASSRQAQWLVLLLGLSPPFLGMATQARPEAFAFTLISSALVLALADRWFWAALLGALAVESHPAAALGCFWLLPQLLQSWSEPRYSFRRVLSAGVGGALAVLIYVLLHRPYLGNLVEALRGGSESLGLGRHFAIEYFFRTKYLRHLPELLIFAGTAVFYFQKPKAFRRLAGPLPAGIVIAGSLLLSRPNFHYMVYLYPLFVLWFVGVFFAGSDRGILRPGLILPALYLALGALIVFKNHDYSGSRWSDSLAQGAAQTQGAVVGPPEAWFVLKDRLILCTDPREPTSPRVPTWILATQEGPCSLSSPGGFLSKLLSDRKLVPTSLPDAVFRKGVVFSWSELEPVRPSGR